MKFNDLNDLKDLVETHIDHLQSIKYYFLIIFISGDYVLIFTSYICSGIDTIQVYSTMCEIPDSYYYFLYTELFIFF